MFVHSARIAGLRPDKEYFYVAVHEGADPETGGFRTAPRGRAAFTFTSFGDQGTPTLTAPTNQPAPAPRYANDNLGSPAAGDVTEGVERIAPLFHLVNGDLCYANLSTVPVRTWSDWFAFNSRSARYRPWMPTAGNHENEALGAHGFEAYQTYFTVPSNRQGPDTQGLWYSFRVGSVKVIALNNDDVSPQPVAMPAQTIDTTQGTLHMIIGGGGTSAPSNQILTTPPVCQVITSVGPGKTPPGPGAPTGPYIANRTQEDAIWSSVRDQDHAYGFAAFTVDPGHAPGGPTSIDVTYYRVNSFGANLDVYDRFRLTRPRRDG